MTMISPPSWFSAYVVSPEDALCLGSTQGQHILRELHLHPGQFPVGEELTLPLHDLLQSAPEKRWCHDGIPAMIDLLQSGLPQTLETEQGTQYILQSTTTENVVVSNYTD